MDADPGGPALVRLAPNRLIPGTRYRLVRWLGDGAMGVVYEAEHVDIERRVAVKILRPQLSSVADAVRAFRDEARAANRVGSKNVVEVHDFAELPDGRVLFAMELLEGKTLAEELAQAPIEPGRAIGILRQICRALAATHSAGVVHRDVKPQNIMLTTVDARQDFVKMLDFGIAAMMAAQDYDDLAGTAAYMAPERVRGDACDGRQDIYSLGCTAYEMLTGEIPFFAPDIADLLRMHLDAPAPAPSRLRAEVPPALDAVVLRCLAKLPEARYADMADLEAALCEAQIGAGLHTGWDDLPLPDVDTARRDQLLARMPDPGVTARRPLRWLLVGAVGVGITLGAAIMSFSSSKLAPMEQSQVEEVVNRARAAAAKASFVYPPADDADEPTAYHHVIALEQTEGEVAEAAQAAGGELRDEFTDTLVRLGDYYWAHEGGQPFAMDYYAQALMFDPNDQRARERANVTFGELASLRWKATRKGFSREELLAVEPLASLAQSDPKQRVEALEGLADKRVHRSASTDAKFAQLLAGERRRAGLEPAPAVAEAEPSPLADEPAAPTAAHAPATPVAKASGQMEAEALASSPRDEDEAQRLAKLGQAARTRNDDAAADVFFSRALAKDDRNLAALVGLADLHFDRTAYAQSARYMSRVVRAKPDNPGYRVKLGDAYFKSLRYADAQRQYAHAKQLGSAEAERRLEIVDEKLGH